MLFHCQVSASKGWQIVRCGPTAPDKHFVKAVPTLGSVPLTYIHMFANVADPKCKLMRKKFGFQSLQIWMTCWTVSKSIRHSVTMNKYYSFQVSSLLKRILWPQNQTQTLVQFLNLASITVDLLQGYNTCTTCPPLRGWTLSQFSLTEISVVPSNTFCTERLILWVRSPGGVLLWECLYCIYAIRL